MHLVKIYRQKTARGANSDPLGLIGLKVGLYFMDIFDEDNKLEEQLIATVDERCEDGE